MYYMTTLIKKPPISIPFISGDKTKVYTIHQGNTHIFSVQENGTAILSFRRKNDSIKFGKLLESHFCTTNQWPILNFEETFIYRVNKSSKLIYLDIKEWQEKDLKLFCIQNAFNILDIHNVDDNYKLYGKNIQWDVPLNFYIAMLNDKLI
jgi:hypothetical protein